MDYSPKLVLIEQREGIRTDTENMKNECLLKGRTEVLLFLCSSLDLVSSLRILAGRRVPLSRGNFRFLQTHAFSNGQIFTDQKHALYEILPSDLVTAYEMQIDISKQTFIPSTRSPATSTGLLNSRDFENAFQSYPVSGFNMLVHFSLL